MDEQKKISNDDVPEEVVELWNGLATEIERVLTESHRYSAEAGLPGVFVPEWFTRLASMLVGNLINADEVDKPSPDYSAWS
jgi:predicted Zn-dependent protease